MENIVNWTALKLKTFKKSYEIAVQSKSETFIFEKNEYVIGYAKYLIEYLEGVFNGKRS